MPGFEIRRHATHQEIHLDGPLDLGTVRRILDELTKAPDFATLDAVWVFGPDVRPLAFHELDDLVAILEKLYARRPTRKRVAIVVPGSFGRSVVQIFLGLTTRLPVTFRVFDTPPEARAWLATAV